MKQIALVVLGFFSIQSHVFADEPTFCETVQEQAMVRPRELVEQDLPGLALPVVFSIAREYSKRVEERRERLDELKRQRALHLLLVQAAERRLNSIESLETAAQFKARNTYVSSRDYCAAFDSVSGFSDCNIFPFAQAKLEEAETYAQYNRYRAWYELARKNLDRLKELSREAEALYEGEQKNIGTINLTSKDIASLYVKLSPPTPSLMLDALVIEGQGVVAVAYERQLGDGVQRVGLELKLDFTKPMLQLWKGDRQAELVRLSALTKENDAANKRVISAALARLFAAEYINALDPKCNFAEAL